MRNGNMCTNLLNSFSPHTYLYYFVPPLKVFFSNKTLFFLFQKKYIKHRHVICCCYMYLYCSDCDVKVTIMWIKIEKKKTSLTHTRTLEIVIWLKPQQARVWKPFARVLSIKTIKVTTMLFGFQVYDSVETVMK